MTVNGLITQRSEVQILPPQPYVNPSAVGIYSAFFLLEEVNKKRQLWRGSGENKPKMHSTANLLNLINLGNIYVYEHTPIFIVRRTLGQKPNVRVSIRKLYHILENPVILTFYGALSSHCMAIRSAGFYHSLTADGNQSAMLP